MLTKKAYKVNLQKWGIIDLHLSENIINLALQTPGLIIMERSHHHHALQSPGLIITTLPFCGHYAFLQADTTNLYAFL